MGRSRSSGRSVVDYMEQPPDDSIERPEYTRRGQPHDDRTCAGARGTPILSQSAVCSGCGADGIDHSVARSTLRAHLVARSTMSALTTRNWRAPRRAVRQERCSRKDDADPLLDARHSSWIRGYLHRL